MKAIILKVYGDYYVENGNPEVLALTKSMLGATFYKGQKRLKAAKDKILSFDLDVNAISLEITPL